MFVCRARQHAGLDLRDYPLPFWAERAYLIGNSVYQQVENTMHESETDASDFIVSSAGDSGAFALIHQHMREMGTRIVGDDED